MKTQTVGKVKAGQYFYTSWGYDQTNIDYIIVVSTTDKTALCRMADKVWMGDGCQTIATTPGQAFGPTFRLRIKEDYTGEIMLRGSYPFCSRPERLDSSKSLGRFRPIRFGETKHETDAYSGH